MSVRRHIPRPLPLQRLRARVPVRQRIDRRRGSRLGLLLLSRRPRSGRRALPLEHGPPSESARVDALRLVQPLRLWPIRASVRPPRVGFLLLFRAGIRLLLSAHVLRLECSPINGSDLPGEEIGHVRLMMMMMI